MVGEADIYGTGTPHPEISKWSCLPPAPYKSRVDLIWFAILLWLTETSTVQLPQSDRLKMQIWEITDQNETPKMRDRTEYEARNSLRISEVEKKQKIFLNHCIILTCDASYCTCSVIAVSVIRIQLVRSPDVCWRHSIILLNFLYRTSNLCGETSFFSLEHLSLIFTKASAEADILARFPTPLAFEPSSFRKGAKYFKIF